MKTNKDLLRRVRLGCCSVALLSACMVNFTSCNKYDLDEQDPAGWGASIYNYLQESGNYSYTTRIINDLGLANQLSKTSSSTLFAADDDAFNRFFAGNKWGVKSYEQLSTAQKKLLLKGSMVSNPYQVADLSSTENRVEGMCMRRVTSSEYLDTVAVVPSAELPNMRPEDWQWNPYWKRFQNRNSVVLLKDATTAPMLHFIEDFMVNNKITNSDYDFLFSVKGDEGKRQAGDASVNGVKVVNPNIRCVNGFVHGVDNVIMPLSNMAEVISNESDLSEFSRLLDRFSFPYYAGKDVTDNYNKAYNTNVDSVFEKRYFSLKSHIDGARGEKGNYTTLMNADNNEKTPFSSDVNGYLPYDPGWNTYFTGDFVSTADELMKNDMGVMLVPTNQAMMNFWNNDAAGQVLAKQYPGGIHTVPNNVIAKLISNSMMTSFVKSVPSKFAYMLNKNNDKIDITENDINRVLLANNGAIYVTDRVIAPTEFVSVLYPATIDDNLSIMEWAITANDYNVYLNSLQAQYRLFLHTNNSLVYLDPLSVLKNSKQEWKLYYFKYDAARISQGKEPVYAVVKNYNSETGEITDIPGDEGLDESYDSMKWRLREILDACIVVNESFDDNVPYYRTMGYQTIKVKHPSQKENGMTFAGSRQINEEGGKELPVIKTYEQKNGISYIVDSDEPIQSTLKSVMDVISEISETTGEMSEFKKIIEDNSDMYLEEIRDKKQYAFTSNVKSFNTFHYTVYVPTNASVQKWLNDNHLVHPTDPSISGWKFVEMEEEGSKQRELDSLKLVNFVRYHFQDNALFIGAKPTSGEYTTSYVQTEDLGEGIKRSKFRKVRATLTNNDITVQDYEKKGPVRKVIKTDTACFNQMAREYFFDGGSNASTCSNLYGASSAVIHLIDGPLETDYTK